MTEMNKVMDAFEQPKELDATQQRMINATLEFMKVGAVAARLQEFDVELHPELKRM
jgi:hypothetical protein